MPNKIKSTVLFKKILELLKNNPYGVSSSDMARMLDINRMTLVKYLTLMQSKGLIEYRNIGMAKVWHTSSKFDLMNMITKEESKAIEMLSQGKKIKSRHRLDDQIPLSLFRVMKAALSLSKEPEKNQYEAGQLIARNCFATPSTTKVKVIIKKLSEYFVNLNLGIILPVQVSPSLWILRLEESSTAYGTNIRGHTLCHFEAGLMSGIISGFLNKKTLVKELKCIGTNNKYCEFAVKFGN